MGADVTEFSVQGKSGTCRQFSDLFNFAYSLRFDIANPDPYAATGHPLGRALTMHRAPSY